MDGAKLITDTIGNLTRLAVDRRSDGTEAFLQRDVDPSEMRILVVVGT